MGNTLSPCPDRGLAQPLPRTRSSARRRGSPTTHKASKPRRRSDDDNDGGPASDEDETQAADDATQESLYWSQAWKFYRDTWPITIANMLEWYEFGCYAFVSDEIAATFFHGSSIAAWGAFASTFVARPVGGVAFGFLSDAYGRRPALVGSVCLMGATTVGQGLVPPLPYVGPGMMLLCRLAQGLATGGEVGSVAVYMAESAPAEIKGMAIQTIGVGGALGTMLACGVGLGLRTWLGPERMLRYGWRLPFLLAIGPAIYALYAVQGVDETEAFQTLQHAREGEAHARPSALAQFGMFLRDWWPQGLLFIGGMSASMTMAYLYGLYLTQWLVTQGVPLATSSALFIAGQGLTILVSPVMGYAVDRVGAATGGLAQALLGAVLCMPSYFLLHKYPHSPVVLVTMGVGVSGLIQGMGSTIFLWFANLFPTEVRGLAVSFYYNLGAIIGGVAPMTCDFLLSKGYPLAPGYYTLVACLVSSCALASSLWMNQNGGQPLRVAYIIDDPY